MIEEDYVSFETAKLLKEKGFNSGVCKNSPHYYYNTDGEFSDQSWDTEYPAPTLQMAMKWLRDEKRYYIQIMLDSWACVGRLGYYVVIQKTNSDFEMMLQDAVDEVFYQTYEEACEAAIKYCLENLV